MKRLAEKLIGIVLTPVLVALGILMLPFVIMLWPVNFIYTKITDKQLENYLLTLGNKNFFCYNNRVGARDFIDKNIYPRLHKGIEFIYIDGRRPESKYEEDKISQIFGKFKNFNRFPHLVKIRNGKIIDLSINNEFFNTRNQNKSPDKLLGTIHRFFDLE